MGACYLFSIPVAVIIIGAIVSVCLKNRFAYWLCSIIAIVFSCMFLSLSKRANGPNGIYPLIPSGNIIIVKMGNITTHDTRSHPIIIMIDGKVIYKNIGPNDTFKRMGNP